MNAIARCDRCELPILEGESYICIAGNTLHNPELCVTRLKAERYDLKPDAERYRHLKTRHSYCEAGDHQNPGVMRLNFQKFYAGRELIGVLPTVDGAVDADRRSTADGGKQV